MVKTRRTVSALTLDLNLMFIHWMVYQMHVYDNGSGIQSFTFGSDCAVANVIYGLTKM